MPRVNRPSSPSEVIIMLLWAIYDIKDNNVRRHIAKMCKAFGLFRVQKSVFCGTIDQNRLDEFIIKSTDMINKKTDSIYFFPMCEKDFKAVKIVGWGFNKKMVADKLKEMVF